MITALSIYFLMALWQQITADQSATIVFAGDAMMHQAQIDASRQKDGTHDFTAYFKSIAPWVSAADYAVVNLECPLGGKPYSGYPLFCAPDSYADALADAGFDLFLTANNHTLDKRDRGLRHTIDVLDGKHRSHIGTYSNIEQRDSVLPFIRNINGINVGFLNYTYATNGLESQAGTVVDYIDRDLMSRDIDQARGKGAEIVCVAVHWGDEYKLLPNYHQKSLADFLVRKGVDLVIGGHPHVIQPMEMRTDTTGRKQLIVYSLGNFISNMKTRDTRGGAMAQVWLSRDSEGVARVDSAAYRLVFTVPGMSPDNNFRLVYVDSCDNKQWQPHCSQFAQSARAIFNKHNKDVREQTDHE